MMHDYAIFGHDRSSVGRWLGVGAILIAGALSQTIAWLGGLTGWEAFSKAIVTTGAVYFTLHWIFNNWAWKIPAFPIPDLNGEWEIRARTLNEDGSTRFAWSGSLGIEQDWKQLAINLRTEQSQSNSYTATLSKLHGARKGWRLSYSYRNEPNLDMTAELNPHKGFCEVELSADLATGTASYFNSGGRKTYGVMELTKKNHD